MEPIDQKYIHLCKEYKVELEENILDQLKRAPSQSEDTSLAVCLNLATHNLTIKTCAILSKILEFDRYFTELKFTDCMLPEDGLKNIILSLATNGTVKSLDLKGNNIRGPGTRALGKLLRNNSTLTSLFLEWNVIGAVQDAFATFADGLGLNTTLTSLDLRSNQISHDCIENLGLALRRNSHLTLLDLRWNNLGLLGGRGVLNALQCNLTLSKIELAGNNITEDILKAIETSLSHNVEKQRTIEEHVTQTRHLTRELDELQRKSKLEVSELSDQFNQQKEIFSKSNMTSLARIVQLQESLEETKAAFESTFSKLKLTEENQSIDQQKVEDLTEMLVEVRKKKEDLENQYQNYMEKSREEQDISERRLMAELKSTRERKSELEIKVTDMEAKLEHQQHLIYDLKEEIALLHAEVKLKGTEAEEMVQVERSQLKVHLVDLEEARQKELSKMQIEFQNQEKRLRDKIFLKEKEQFEYQEEISHTKAAAVQERLNLEEKMMLMKQKMKDDELKKVKYLEDKLRTLEISNIDLQHHATQQSHVIEELQRKNSNYNLEVNTLKRKMQDLSQELSGKDKEMLAEVSKVQSELKEQLAIIQQERLNQQELLNKIKILERQLTDSNSNYEQDIDHKNQRIAVLQDQLRQKENEILSIKEDEMHRGAMLQSAIMNYIKTPLRSPPRPL